MRRWFNTYEDVLHIYFSEYIRSLSSSELQRVSPESWWQRIKLSLRIIQKRLKHFFKSAEAEEKLNGKVWLFVLSKNNLDALSFLYSKLPNTILVADKDRDIYASYPRCIPILRFQIFHVVKFPFLLAYLMRKKGRQVFRIAPVVLKSMGFIEEWSRLLSKAKPQAIIFTNDHNIESRSLLLAAKRLKIRTVYLQHASVSPSFPPLRFGLNLLEGQDSFDKYNAIEKIQGTVKLVGMPKFDHYVSRRKPKTQIHTVGIPYNFNDKIEMVTEMVRSLRSAFPALAVTVRRHPKDRSDFSIAASIEGVSESNPKNQSAFEFLVNQDCIIAGNSSIHLEAILLNIPSVYFNFSPGTFIDDYYGYVRNDLSYPASSFNKVHEFIAAFNHSPWDVFQRASYYNALVGKPEEDESQNVVFRHIKAFIQQ